MLALMMGEVSQKDGLSATTCCPGCVAHVHVQYMYCIYNVYDCLHGIPQKVMFVYTASMSLMCSLYMS